jgi:hypothetical protein
MMLDGPHLQCVCVCVCVYVWIYPDRRRLHHRRALVTDALQLHTAYVISVYLSFFLHCIYYQCLR